jgi:curved DNA-binding protein CbpA
VNYYELLKIERDANVNEIKRAYFSAVKLHSPDSDPEGFKAIRTAYETLTDQKKRAEYDAFFTASGDLQNDLLAARELIRENKYKQAMEFLTELSDKYPDSTDVKRLLATVLWYLKKSGTADKLCGELLEKDPSDYETLLLRARIVASMRRIDKANKYFTDAVNVDPLNPKIWVAYMRFGLTEGRYRVSNIFYRAMEQDKNMFRDEYILYLLGACESNLFNSDNYLEYYDKFAEFYINDKNPDEEIYSEVMNLMPRFLEDDELVPFIEKILPTLEKSKQYSDEDEKSFKYIRAAIVIHKLRSDKRIHDVLVDLTGCLLEEDEEGKNDRLEMEVYIVFHISDLRPSIKALKNEYPECFKLNQAFYVDVLNERKEEFLMDKYAAIYKKIRPKNAVFHGEEFYDDDDEVPYKRESPKIGRNDPCPCGSGKKYKKCCGA